MMAELDPGPVTFTAQLAKQGGKAASTLDVMLEEDQSVLIEINLEMSMTAVTLLFNEHKESQIMSNQLMVDWLVKL
jgi:D-alanine-D-alanine ligase-like ATP-grasp enzyme